MGKVGRPRIDNKKLKKVTIRMSDEDYELLMEYNESHNMTITDTMSEAFDMFMKKKKLKG